MARVPGSPKTKEKLNLYTVSILAFVGLGSLNFGYPAAVIGTLLGEQCHPDFFIPNVLLIIIRIQVNLHSVWTPSCSAS